MRSYGDRTNASRWRTNENRMDFHYCDADTFNHQELRMNIEQAVQVFKALMDGPASRQGLADKTGATPKAVGRMLTELKKQKMIYVIDYKNATDGRNRVKIYSFGDGEDAQPRKTQSQEDRSRRSYLKKKAIRNTFTPKTTFVGGSLWQ